MTIWITCLVKFVWCLFLDKILPEVAHIYLCTCLRPLAIQALVYCTHVYNLTYPSLPPSLPHFFQLIAQFVESERLYFNELVVIDTYFYQPLKMMAVFKPDILSTMQLETLFLNRYAHTIPVYVCVCVCVCVNQVRNKHVCLYVISVCVCFFSSKFTALLSPKQVNIQANIVHPAATVSVCTTIL